MYVTMKGVYRLPFVNGTYYERGTRTFSVKNSIQKCKGLDLGVETPLNLFEYLWVYCHHKLHPYHILVFQCWPWEADNQQEIEFT